MLQIHAESTRTMIPLEKRIEFSEDGELLYEGKKISLPKTSFIPSSSFFSTL